MKFRLIQTSVQNASSQPAITSLSTTSSTSTHVSRKSCLRNSLSVKVFAIAFSPALIMNTIQSSSKDAYQLDRVSFFIPLLLTILLNSKWLQNKASMRGKLMTTCFSLRRLTSTTNRILILTLYRSSCVVILAHISLLSRR